MRAVAARWTVLELLHPIPSLLTTLAAMGFAWIFGIGLRDGRFWRIGAIMLLVQFSISALNEWADADLDRRARRRRPIPLGLVSRGAALSVAVVCAVGAFLLCVLSDLGPFALLLVGVGTACGWAYDLWLKATPLSFVPFAIGFPLITLGIITGALWAQAVWGLWARDAKVLFSFVTWFVYMLLIFYRLIAGWRGRKAAYLSIVGFIGVLVTFLGANYFGGLHTFNQ